jgi:hypothetical protein
MSIGGVEKKVTHDGPRYSAIFQQEALSRKTPERSSA